MRLSIVDKKGANLAVDNKTLKVDDQKIPLRLVDTLIIANNNKIETKELIKITKEDISLLLLSYDHKDAALITPAQGRNAELKLAQYKALRYHLPIAKMLIERKIRSHVNHLQNHHIEIESDGLIERIKNCDELQSLLGIEGSFSKLYFTHYFGLFPKALHSGKRTKNPPLDPLNAMMSFCYMLFYNLITVKLIAYGFEPTIGYLHKPFRSHHALASDLMEPIRADINAFVYEVFAQKIIEKEDFTKKQGVYLRYEGRKKLWKKLKPFIDTLDPKIDLLITDLRGML